jgi:hypothetical protein
MTAAITAFGLDDGSSLETGCPLSGGFGWSAAAAVTAVQTATRAATRMAGSVFMVGLIPDEENGVTPYTIDLALSFFVETIVPFTDCKTIPPHLKKIRLR